LSELKGKIADHEIPATGSCETRVREKMAGSRAGALAVFSNAGRLVQAAKICCDAGFQELETFSPVKLEQLETVLCQPKSPVHLFTLAGAVSGLIGGFWLAIGTAQVNHLIVGGKPPVSIIPFCVIGFEGTILLGSLANLLGLVIFARLYRIRTAPFYDPRFSRDKFGLLINCSAGQALQVKKLLDPAAPEEFHVHH
jgi:molybdopterin-containing oxidoreductase family membrane subunit